MRTYMTMDGEVLKAPSATALVAQLHQGSWAQAPDDATFMEQYANRVELQCGRIIRHDSPEHFIDDLLANGRLEQLEDK